MQRQAGAQSDHISHFFSQWLNTTLMGVKLVGGLGFKSERDVEIIQSYLHEYEERQDDMEPAHLL